MTGLFTLASLLAAALGKETFDGHQVLRIAAKDNGQLSLIKDLEDLVELDFWRGATRVGSPVDVRVPVQSLQSIKTYLDILDIEYSILIEDLQTLLEEEQEAMRSPAPVDEPRNTDDFDFSRYHTLRQVSVRGSPHLHGHGVSRLFSKSRSFLGSNGNGLPKRSQSLASSSKSVT